MSATRDGTADAGSGTPPVRPEALYREPNALAPDYSRFRVAERLLLTGHSHQAWPDRGYDGQLRAWEDAARLVDAKWDEAFARADRVRAGWARLLGPPGTPDDGDIALGGSTHELVVRLLSALPLRERPRLVTTLGEFHSIRRQLDRLAEEEIEIVRVPVDPIDALAERLAAAVDDRTAAALVSCVLFRDARIVPGLSGVQERCRDAGTALLVDAYHALGAIPWTPAEEGLEDAFVVGGGYKYCQLGEGNCFLRTPPGCELRPVITGWFAEFGALEGPEADGPAGLRADGAGGPGADPPAGSDGVAYGAGPARFAGSTYDPTSHYRASEVFDFFAERGLEPALLRGVSRHQVARLARRIDDLDLDPTLLRRAVDGPLDGIAGFLALRTPYAAELRTALAARGVATDCRDDLLRLGPAPYLCDRQLDDAVAALDEAARELEAPP